MYSNSCSIAESMGDKSPRGFDSIWSTHRIVNNKDRARHGQPTGWIIDPVLYSTSASNYLIIFHECRSKNELVVCRKQGQVADS